MSGKSIAVSVLARPKTCNQTPRHSSTKLIKRQGTVKVKAEHWDYTTWGLIQDFKKRKEGTTETKFLSESLKSKRKILGS